MLRESPSCWDKELFSTCYAHFLWINFTLVRNMNIKFIYVIVIFSISHGIKGNYLDMSHITVNYHLSF